jgi:anti-anti-sigma factor
MANRVIADFFREMGFRSHRFAGGAAGSDQRFQVRHSRPGRKLSVCAVIGDVDLHTAPLLAHALARAETRNGRSLVVDLSRTEFLGAAGVTTLETAARRAEERRCSFAVVTGSPLVRRVFELTGADQKFTSYRSLPDALRAFRDIPPVGGGRPVSPVL